MTKIIDVTVPLTSDVATFPGDPPFRMEFTHRLDEGAPYNVAQLSMGSHAGTHVDAPLHFIAGGQSVDALPLELLMGKARVVSVSARERVERKDLEDLDLSEELRVLIRTRNSGQVRSAFREDFVYLAPDAAHYLVDAGIKVVGFDYISVERFGSTSFETHHALLGAGVIIIEGLDLSAAEPGDYEMACLPLCIEGADAAPARVVLRKRV
jgi:arylformamidase